MATPPGMPKRPLCDGPATHSESIDTARRVECERCGRFRITMEAYEDVLQPKPQLKPLLSAYCRRMLHGTQIPVITTATINQFVNSLPKYTPPEKFDFLLELMGRMSPALGEYTKFDTKRDYPLLIARGPDEVEFYLMELHKRGYVNGTLAGGAYIVFFAMYAFTHTLTCRMN